MKKLIITCLFLIIGLISFSQVQPSITPYLRINKVSGIRWLELNVNGTGLTWRKIPFVNGSHTLSFITTANTSLTLPASGTLITNQAGLADDATQGIASYHAADFDQASGNISIDYANGQKASHIVPGFMTAADKARLDSTQFIKVNNFTNFDSAFRFNGDTLISRAFRVSTIGSPGVTITKTQDRDSTHWNITGAAPTTAVGLQQWVEFALSDETTAITTGTAKLTWYAPFALTITGIRGFLSTPSSSGTPTIDINEAGTTILSTKLTIDATEETSVTAATPVVISDVSIADNAKITFDFDVAGTGAKGAKVRIYYTKN